MALQRNRKILLFPKFGKAIIVIVSVGLLVVGVRGYQLYMYVFQPNVKHNLILEIPHEATYNQVADSLKTNDALENLKSFEWVAKKKNYPATVKPGRYLLEKGMSNNEAIDMLRGGKQQPVDLTFNNVRKKEQFAAAIDKYLEADSVQVLKIFYDTLLIKELGFSPSTFPTMFIPNTYEIYWTTSPGNFAKRMKIEYDKFWNEERKTKADRIGLTPIEVSILASIVQEETVKNDEKPVVAGLYLNRLKRGMPLQADPTIKYAVNNFTLRRVLNTHLEMDSPYNTYKFAGLPPGPINFPEISSIDAVLNPKKHNFIYMCAKSDFSGYHNFAQTLAQHNRNADAYRAALDANKIFK
jgi:UPF0755 protein